MELFIIAVCIPFLSFPFLSFFYLFIFFGGVIDTSISQKERKTLYIFNVKSLISAASAILSHIVNANKLLPGLHFSPCLGLYFVFCLLWSVHIIRKKKLDKLI